MEAASGPSSPMNRKYWILYATLTFRIRPVLGEGELLSSSA